MKKESKLKQFTRQYNHKWIAGYLYIECPMPIFELYDAAGWRPSTEDLPAVTEGIKKLGRMKGYACFFERATHTYFVIDHLWLASLTAWGEQEMQEYTRTVFSKMLSKTWEQPMVIKADAKDKKAMTVAVVNTQTTLLEDLKAEAEEDLFFEKYGITTQVYNNMKKDAYILETNKGYLHVLDLCKFLYNHEGLKMADIYSTLKKLGIVSQPSKDQGGQYKIYLCQEWIDRGLGVQLDYDDKTYPSFSNRGLISLGMILHEQGLLSKYLLPA